MTLTAYQFFCFLGFIAIGLLLMVLVLILVGRGEPKSVFGSGADQSYSAGGGYQPDTPCMASGKVERTSPFGVTSPTTATPVLPPRDACMEDIKRRMSISN